MKAVRYHECGGPEVLRWEEVAEPGVGAQDVLIKVEAAGVNFADIMRRSGEYHFKTEFPAPLGTEAAGVVVMDNSLEKVDEFMHIGRRMRSIALQSAVGGMALSVIGMAFAATGHLSPVGGAISQEVIDVLAVLNALRAAFPPSVIHDL